MHYFVTYYIQNPKRKTLKSKLPRITAYAGIDALRRAALLMIEVYKIRMSKAFTRVFSILHVGQSNPEAAGRADTYALGSVWILFVNAFNENRSPNIICVRASNSDSTLRQLKKYVA
eukprot:2670042-Pyramimonas_sp.AAC.1